MASQDFLAELRRRNVYKAAVAYVVVAWLLIQAASILLPTFDAPAWMMKVFVILLVLGFAPALIFAWAFEITPQESGGSRKSIPTIRLRIIPGAKSSRSCWSWR